MILLIFLRPTNPWRWWWYIRS